MIATPTVVPAIFKDPDRALANLVDAKERLDRATQALAASGRETMQPPSSTMGTFLETALLQGRAKQEKLVVEVEQARSAFDVAFAIYQETARARDAAASSKFAESNTAAAVASTNAMRRVVALTIVLAAAAVLQTLAAIVQILRTWSSHT